MLLLILCIVVVAGAVIYKVSKKEKQPTEVIETQVEVKAEPVVVKKELTLKEKPKKVEAPVVVKEKAKPATKKPSSVKTQNKKAK
jgi:LAS superfamily LD-carboxypeptidase LdcB